VITWLFRMETADVNLESGGYVSWSENAPPPGGKVQSANTFPLPGNTLKHDRMHPKEKAPRSGGTRDLSPGPPEKDEQLHSFIELLGHRRSFMESRSGYH
jgi:hypothetical protein